MAAAIAGRIYHQLHADEYFTEQSTSSDIQTLAVKTSQ
jgi:hypothetical protein